MLWMHRASTARSAGEPDTVSGRVNSEVAGWLVTMWAGGHLYRLRRCRMRLVLSGHTASAAQCALAGETDCRTCGCWAQSAPLVVTSWKIRSPVLLLSNTRQRVLTQSF